MASLRRVFVGLVLVAGCSDSSKDIKSSVEDPSTGKDAGSTETCADGADIACDGDVAIACDDGKEGERSDCSKFDQVCVQDVGCAACEPDEYECSGNQSVHCSDEGSWEAPVTCKDGCDSLGRCNESLCDKAANTDSYIGCDYWAVTTANGQLNEVFEFAVVVANPQDVPATVTVSQGGELNCDRQCAARRNRDHQAPLGPAAQGRFAGRREVRAGARWRVPRRVERAGHGLPVQSARIQPRLHRHRPGGWLLFVLQ